MSHFSNESESTYLISSVMIRDRSNLWICIRAIERARCGSSCFQLLGSSFCFWPLRRLSVLFSKTHGRSSNWSTQYLRWPIPSRYSQDEWNPWAVWLSEQINEFSRFWSQLRQEILPRLSRNCSMSVDWKVSPFNRMSCKYPNHVCLSLQNSQERSSMSTLTSTRHDCNQLI